MSEFIVPGEEYFQDGKLKPEYEPCPRCGKPEAGGLCDKCLEELEIEETGDDGLYDV